MPGLRRDSFRLTGARRLELEELAEALAVERKVRALLADFERDYVERLEEFHASDASRWSDGLPSDREAVGLSDVIDKLREALA